MPSNIKKSSDDYRKHITAAKEWLGQAEESIDEENNIRSDLNLMLAQAELQRAKEKDDIKLWRKWLKWTIPWIAALVIAAGYVLLLRPEAEPVKPIVKVDIPALPMESAVEQSAEPAEEAVPQEIVTMDNSREILQMESVQTNEEMSQKGLPQNSEMSAVAEEQAVQSQASPLPVEDIHRLMQSAGKSLRE